MTVTITKKVLFKRFPLAGEMGRKGGKLFVYWNCAQVSKFKAVQSSRIVND